MSKVSVNLAAVNSLSHNLIIFLMKTEVVISYGVVSKHIHF